MVVLCMTCLLGACGLIRAHQEQVSARNNGVIVGRVSIGYVPGGPIVVGAWRQTGEGKPVLAQYSILDAAGSFILVVPPGDYRVMAFEDANHNLRLDEEEAAAVYPGPVVLAKNALLAAIDVTLEKKGRQDVLAVGTTVPPKPVAGLQSSRSGAVADLGNPLFSGKYAADTGYWEGLSFFQEGGGNIYFLEPYDPHRIPVLFVHGTRGSPQDWKFAFSQLDTKRYQPCFFYYPTASSLTGAATLLAMKLTELQQSHFITRMHIVAHSSGGLVVRDFLRRYAPVHPYIDTFISISTPWGGERLAQIGVEHSPLVLPAWVDMQPTSGFFAQLYREPLPPSIRHYMLFGYRGGTPLRANNDGAILLESLLDARVQSEAQEVRGFNESHFSVLDSPEVFTEVNRILVQRDADYIDAAAGVLKLQLADASVQEEIDSMSNLLLRDEQGKTRSIPLLLQDGSVTFPDVPAGEYKLRVRSLHVRMQPEELSVTVQADTTTTAVLPLQVRQGSICGVVVRPNEEYRAAGLKEVVPVAISKVSLRGAGIVRRAETHYATPDDAPLAGDFTTPGLFCFVDLPNGDYSIDLRSAAGTRDLHARLPVKGWSPLIVNF